MVIPIPNVNSQIFEMLYLIAIGYYLFTNSIHYSTKLLKRTITLQQEALTHVTPSMRNALEYTTNVHVLLTIFVMGATYKRERKSRRHICILLVSKTYVAYIHGQGKGIPLVS